MKLKSIKMSVFSLILVPIILGGLVYIGFRSDKLLMHDWFRFLKIDEIMYSIRTILSPLKKLLPEWSYYSLPNALWVYSFIMSINILWKNHNEKKYWLAVVILICCSLELLQLTPLINGTFDIIDFITILIAILFGIIPLNYKINKNEKFNIQN